MAGARPFQTFERLDYWANELKKGRGVSDSPYGHTWQLTGNN